MDEEIFDQMVQALQQLTVHKPPMPTSTRWQPDGTYDKKPNDPNYFSKHYQKKYQPVSPVPTADAPFRPNPIYQNIVKPTFVRRKDASVEIQNFCNNNHFYWEGFYVEVQPQSQKFQQPTKTQKLLKEMPPYRV